MHDLPDLDLLRCFAMLHRDRHVTRAAEAVGLSQPAMSRALGRLRDAFADPLFVRGPRGMLATPRADALAPQVLAILDAAGALVRPAAFDPAKLARAFTIGTTDFFDAELVPRLVELLASAPGVSIVTRPLGEDVDDALATGRLDLAIGVAANVPPNAMAARLFDDGFTCAIRRDHPGVGKRLTLARYVELPHLLIAPRGLPGGTVDDALAKLGLSRRIVVRTHTFVSAPAIVAGSDLILTGPTRVLAPLAEPFRLRLLPPPLELPRFVISQIWHPRVQHDPAHAWFRGLVATAAKRRERSHA